MQMNNDAALTVICVLLIFFKHIIELPVMDPWPWILLSITQWLMRDATIRLRRTGTEPTAKTTSRDQRRITGGSDSAIRLIQI